MISDTDISHALNYSISEIQKCSDNNKHVIAPLLRHCSHVHTTTPLYPYHISIPDIISHYVC